MYRHQKHVQYEMTQDQLEARKEQLDDLEKSEREAKRLEEALSQGRVSSLSASRISQPGADDENGTEEGSAGASDGVGSPQPEPSSVYLPPHPGPNPVRRRAPGMGFLSALSYTLHGMMDVDPETARRNNITKTRETISQVRTAPDCRLKSRDAHIGHVVGGCLASGSARSEVLQLDHSGRP